VGILVTFVALAAARFGDIALLAVAAAAACLVTGCISLRTVIRTVDWNVLGLLAGAVTLGLALERSGLAAAGARLVVRATRDGGPQVVLCTIYLLTSIATEFVSNSGAAALMVPIAIATAGEVDASPRPFVFAVAFAASASFSTPIGYQTNTFVYGPGGYRFRDFLRVGVPLQLLLWIYASLTLPLAFPF
jgi:di/tricarboxylate transporter